MKHSPIARATLRTFTRGISLVWAFALPACAATPSPQSSDEANGGRAKGDEQPGTELSAREVVLELRGNETELRRCFFANPSARGTLTFSWRVSRKGYVERIEREHSSLAEPRIEQCLAKQLAEVRFDPRAEPARASWTFVFRLVGLAGNSKRSPKQPSRQDRARAADEEPGVELEQDSPGFLAPEVVDNVVESGFPLFARCYRDGVQRNSSLGGAVRLRFVVNASGKVIDVADRGSDLSDRQVVDCVAEGFYALRFPQPARGDVHLLYRIHFDSG